MRLKVFNNNILKLKKQRNISMIFGLGMMVSNFFLLFIIITSNHKTYLVPPYLNQQVWASNNQVSKSYLEEMSLFYSHLLLEVSPSSAPYKRDVLLKHVSPQYYGALKGKLISDENRYTKENLTTSFKVVSLEVNEEKMEVTLEGVLDSYIASKKIKQSKDKYLISYKYELGNLQIDKFKLLESR